MKTHFFILFLIIKNDISICKINKGVSLNKYTVKLAKPFFTIDKSKQFL